MRFLEGGDGTIKLVSLDPDGEIQPRTNTYQEYFNHVYEPLVGDLLKNIHRKSRHIKGAINNLYYNGIRVVDCGRVPLGFDFIIRLETGENVQLTTMEFIRFVELRNDLSPLDHRYISENY